MVQAIYTIKENVALTALVYKMVLEGDTSALTAPGQFVNVQLEGKFLRRPISVCDYDNLCKQLLKEGKNVQVILGFNTKDEIFYEEEFKALGAGVHVATADGSYGTKGFVTDVLKDLNYTYFYTCGPMPMFKAIEATAVTSGQYSFEERMGCGFGACMGCSCKTKYGNKRICREGPVLEREEIIW